LVKIVKVEIPNNPYSFMKFEQLAMQ